MEWDPATTLAPNHAAAQNALTSPALMAAAPSALRRLLLLFSLLLLASVAAAAEGEEEEEFTEELLLRPLPDRKALAHFHFRSSAPPSAAAGRHHHVFPKAIAQLVRAPPCSPPHCPSRYRSRDWSLDLRKLGFDG